MKTIIFDTAFKQDILSAFGKQIKEGIIVEKETGIPVLTAKGEVINKNEFAGVKKGSELYLKNDIASLIEFVNRK